MRLRVSQVSALFECCLVIPEHYSNVVWLSLSIDAVPVSIVLVRILEVSGLDFEVLSVLYRVVHKDQQVLDIFLIRNVEGEELD